MGGLARRMEKPQTKPYQRIRENQKRIGEKIATPFSAQNLISEVRPNKNLNYATIVA